MAPQLFKGPMSLTLAEQQLMQDEESRVKMTDEQLEKFNTWANDREPDVSDAKFWIEKNTNLDFNAFSFKYLNLLIKRAVWISHKTASKALKTSVVKRPGFGLPLGHMPGVEKQFPVLFMGGNDEWTAVTLLVRECCMLRAINELSDKPEWWLKVKNNDITAKWKREALEMNWESYIKYADFTTAMADACISELRKKAYIFEKTGIVPVYDYSTAVIKSDNILTPELLSSLRNAVKPLENVPSEQQDWHPRSNEQVLNLVHPSLWPLMYGRTRVLQDRVIGVEDALDYCGMGIKLRSPAKAETTQSTFRQWSSREGLKVLSNEFQWLPCDVKIDPATGRAKIASYINNLHPKEHAHLYPIIEQFIEKSLPAWDAIYRWEKEFAVQRLTTDDVRRNHCPCPEICGQRRCQPHLRPLSEGDAPRHIRDLERTKRDKAWFAETHGMKLPDADPEAKDYVRIGASDIKSNSFFNNKKRIQVIVKLANIHLTPEKPSYEGGSWHTEGLLNEHIISTALYYYDSENITDCTLDFRTLADREDLSSELSYDQYDWAGIKQAFAIDPRGNTIQNIGSPDTMSPSKESSSAELTEMDPRGDLVFIVGSAAEDTPARSFRVCSRTMARVSPVFDRMLHGSFVEAKPTTNSDSTAIDWVVELREDKPDTFELFASIAHAKFRQVPRSLPIDRLYDLTVLTHYYDATPMLTPWLQNWVTGIGETPDVGVNGLLMPKLLWISWELGHKQLFESTARRMVMECRGTGEEIELEGLSTPPDIIERIKSVRTQTIQSIMDLFRDLAERLITVDEGERWCRHAMYMGPHRCESMILGSMTFCLTRAGLWPIPDAADVEDSVVTLYSTLMNLVIHDIGKPAERGGVDHAECNPQASALVLVPEPTADPNDPLNWSLTRKYVNAIFVFAVTVAVFAAMTMQMVLWQQMTVELDMSYDELNAGVSFNVVGLAMGCLLIIPFTKKYGRRSTYIFSTAIMAATSWWSSRMYTVPEMYITNLLFGLAGSTNETIAEMTIADLFFVHQRGLANGFYITCVMIGNFLAPTLAGVQAATMGWRWTYYTVGIILTILSLLFVFFFEETKYIPVSVGLNDQGLDIALPRPVDINADEEKLPETLVDRDIVDAGQPIPLNTYRQRMRFFTQTDESLLSGYLTPFKTAAFPHVVFAAIQCANAVAFLVLLTSINSIVFAAPPYSFSTAGVGLMLIGPFIGNLIGSVYGGLLGDWIVVRLARKNRGIFEPEMRLYILFLPALVMGAGVIIFGATADRGMHWVYPSIGGACFAFGMGSMMDVAFTIVIDTYKTITAESFVFITFIRNAATIGVPFAVVPWLNAMSLTNISIISGTDSLPTMTLVHDYNQLTKERAPDDMSWQDLVAEKRRKLSDAIPADWRLKTALVEELTQTNGGHLLELDHARRSGILNERELDITGNHSAVSLIEKMAFGHFTATEVVTAFCKRAAVAQQLDTFKVVGYDATAGYVNGLKLGPATTNSCLVSVLLDAGAVLYVKTNVPQTLMTGDSENNIFGRTLNPHNLNLNAGGSSGGEGALVAFRGSPIGVGTDIAGSIRIPSMCCGNYGFKPTNHRVPYGNQSEGPVMSLPGPFPSAGPIASSMQDLELFMKAVIGQRPGAYDPTALDLQWRQPAAGPRLRIGVMEEEPAWPLHPPVRRAYESATQALTAAGHDVVRLPYDYERSADLGIRLACQFFELSHPPDEDLAAILGEPLVKSAAARMHPFTTNPRPVLRDMAHPWRHLDDLDLARAKYTEAWHKAWFGHKLNVLLAPGADKTAVPHDTYGLMPYTVVFNLLDYPSCLIPTGRASKALDPEPVKASGPFLPDYDPDAVDGAPCGIQVVTPRLRDEECLAAATIIDRVVNGSSN
ncbi:hypothetical protein CkaCkLH20_01692 [Colletotrichum karsti]|uniref:amidase n=1 Tax=Colletotrichum karsti TaxID=1095194 RepID=A0A9P6LPB5_9PEZI|nr:uncharacterized protein CkaCkLH20_01692 [Colletotrichum karsti]KAF9880650.1 hypothetical protein CkaCkLH20_01692 [Colletotrichum karsti]